MTAAMSDSPMSWLNQHFLETILQESNPGAIITIKRFEITKAGPKGGGYMSELNRAVVEFRTNDGELERLSLIIKTPPNEINQFENSVKLNAFLKETTFYQTTLPAMRCQARLKAPGKIQHPFAPRSFPSTRPNTLVLEDLTASGFVVADRRQGLGYEHCLLVLRCLANFHAMSILQYQKDPNSMSTFIERHYSQDNYDINVSYFTMAFEALISNIRKTEGLERFVSKLNALADRACNIMMEQVKPKESGVSVLNHGDIWVNNLLFKCDSHSGKVQDVRFVDFQLSRFSSPALDLLFFFYLSMREDVILHRLDDLVEEYHKELVDCLKWYGIDPDIMTLEHLQQELKEKEPYALVTYCSKIWFALINPDHVDSVVLPNKYEKGKDTFNCLVRVYSDLVIRNSFEKILPYFESKGVL